MGGATLIAIAIAVFVLLVSAQVFRDWPIAALGGSDESAAVSDAEAAPAGGRAVPTTAVAQAASANAKGSRNAASRDGSGGGSTSAVALGPTTGGSPQTGSGGSGGGGQGAGSGSTDSPQGAPASGTATSAGGGGNGGGGGATGPSGGTTNPSTSGQVTGAVNDTVSKVDETALGGTLEESGVTETTEEVVNGVAGPESAVGKVVDGATETVGGLLGKP
jgi:hypothetical protein